MPRRTTTWGLRSAEQGKLDEAVASYQRALRLKPDYAEAHNNLGVAFKEQGKLTEAVAAGRGPAPQARLCRAHNNLGVAFKEQGKLEAAVASYQQALRLKPDYAEAHATWEWPGFSWAISSAGGPSMSGGGSVRILSFRAFLNRYGTALLWMDERFCCMRNKDWATRCNSSASRRWSKSAVATFWWRALNRSSDS